MEGKNNMLASGKVFKYGDNIDTDVIIPARYLNTPDMKELASHCMEDIDKEFVEKIVMKNVPFAMHCQIIWLNDRSCFDEYCYIDYNSRLMDIQLDDFQGYSCFDEARMV